MLVYLDNCCYNRPFDDQTQIKIMLETKAKMYIQGLIADKEIDMEYLLDKLGVLDTEIFISGLLRDRFDYTEWQREYFSKYSADDFLDKAAEYDKRNPISITQRA